MVDLKNVAHSRGVRDFCFFQGLGLRGINATDHLTVALDLRMSLYSSHVGLGLGNFSHSIFNFFRSDSKKALELIRCNLAIYLPKAKPAPAKASAG